LCAAAAASRHNASNATRRFAPFLDFDELSSTFSGALDIDCECIYEISLHRAWILSIFGS
jgi:hypothetical protein